MDIITDRGEELLSVAAQSSSKVQITHIALGDGNGGAYEPDFAQTALRNERLRKPIDSRRYLGNGSWQVNVSFAADVEAFPVNEIGYFDAEGNLISLWTGLNERERHTGATEYLIKHTLNTSRVANGLLEVSAPDDEVWTHAIVDAAAQMQCLLLTVRGFFAQREMSRAVRRNSRAIKENELKRRRQTAA